MARQGCLNCGVYIGEGVASRLCGSHQLAVKGKVLEKSLPRLDLEQTDEARSIWSFAAKLKSRTDSEWVNFSDTDPKLEWKIDSRFYFQIYNDVWPRDVRAARRLLWGQDSPPITRSVSSWSEARERGMFPPADPIDSLRRQLVSISRAWWVFRRQGVDHDLGSMITKAIDDFSREASTEEGFDSMSAGDGAELGPRRQPTGLTARLLLEVLAAPYGLTTDAVFAHLATGDPIDLPFLSYGHTGSAGFNVPRRLTVTFHRPEAITPDIASLLQAVEEEDVLLKHEILSRGRHRRVRFRQAAQSVENTIRTWTIFCFEQKLTDTNREHIPQKQAVALWNLYSPAHLCTVPNFNKQRSALVKRMDYLLDLDRLESGGFKTDTDPVDS